MSIQKGYENRGKTDGYFIVDIFAWWQAISANRLKH